MTPEIAFTSTLDKYNAVEVHPVFEDEDNNCEICEPDQANLWSVYLHYITGGIECVADWPNEDAAMVFAFGLEMALECSNIPLIKKLTA